MNTKQVAIDRAIVLLNASGAAYKVIFEEQQYGELVVVPPKPPKPVRRKIQVNSFKHLYVPILDSMQPGDSHEWEHDNIEPLRSAISAAAHNRWGSQSSISEVKGNKMELLRIC